MEESRRKIIAPHAGFQERFVSSNVDFVIGGGAMAAGKTFGALLMAAEHVSDPLFRMVFVRRNISDTKTGGGGADEAGKLYGHMASMKLSDSPRLTFPSGAFIDFTHMADQTPENVIERVRGWQYSCIYVDEATGHEWSTIRILMSRNRSQAKWTGKFRVTCNPKKRSWLRYWVDWYVDDMGYPIPERDGVVRYFYVMGENVNEVVLGATKEEVYAKCKHRIDQVLAKTNSSSDTIFTYRDVIKSYTFYGGNVAENKALLGKDAGYIGSVAAMGERQAQANLLGCWDVDEDDDENPIARDRARSVGENEPQTNGDRWVTVDLADTGTDNCVLLAWDGLHVTDFQTIERSTPAANCAAIDSFAARHGVGEAHIIYDAQRAAYMIDRFPSAMGYLSYKPATGVYRRVGERLKDVCFLRLAECVNNERLSVAPEVAAAPYRHAGRRDETFASEFARECAVVAFDSTPSGKLRLKTKKAMNKALGSRQSMDLLDAAAMRMWPLCGVEYGQELCGRKALAPTDADEDGPGTIYDDGMWF